MSHIPVLFDETLDSLDLKPGAFVIDGTIDGGGHAAGILAKIGEKGRLLGLDWDAELLKQCEAKIGHLPNVILRHSNYADVAEVIAAEGLPKADALLLDLGFSSEQLDSGKGLSFKDDQPLRMTYSSDEAPLYALLQKMDEDELIEVIRELGEERYAPRIGRAIYARERSAPLKTTGELAALVRESVPANYERGRLDPATRTFQALRIYANDELGNLRRLLNELPKIMQPGGRVAIISFHSLEDRIVKHEFRRMEQEGLLKIVTKKPIEAKEEEILHNPRSRSAKLRVAEMLSEQES